MNAAGRARGILRVRFDPPAPGAANMAADAALLARHRHGDPPVLRLYRWDPPAVSYGYHQSPADFDRAVLAAHGWDLVQRPTGGRAILHARELTYAVVGDSPSPLFGDTLHAVYATINRGLLRFLRELGLAPDVSEGEALDAARGAVCFRSAGHHEITVGGRKLVGSAQRRTEGKFLQHGTILTGPDHLALLDCLAPAVRERLDRDAVAAAVTDLSRELGRPLDAADHVDLAHRLAAACAAEWGLEPVPWEEVAGGRA